MDQKHSGLLLVLEDNRSALLRFLISRTRDAALAEDLLQDVWVKIAAAHPAGPIDSPVAYIYKMCENAVRDAKRSDARKLARETLWSETDAGLDGDRTDQLTPEKIAIERDNLKHVLAELETLPERTRQILIDFRLGGMTQKEIASNLEISISAVEKHLQRAYQKIIEYRQKNDAGINGS